jgi:hypothetical protein
MPDPTSEATTAGCKAPKAIQDRHLSKDGKWRYFPKVPNLVQYTSTGTYYARAKLNGNSVRRSLETTVFSVAKLKLADKLKEIRKPRAPLGSFGEALERYLAEMEHDHTILPNTLKYRRNCLQALAATWPALGGLPLGKITAAGCKEWARSSALESSERNCICQNRTSLTRYSGPWRRLAGGRPGTARTWPASWRTPAVESARPRK